MGKILTKRKKASIVSVIFSFLMFRIVYTFATFGTSLYGTFVERDYERSTIFNMWWCVLFFPIVFLIGGCTIFKRLKIRKQDLDKIEKKEKIKNLYFLFLNFIVVWFVFWYYILFTVTDAIADHAWESLIIRIFLGILIMGVHLSCLLNVVDKKEKVKSDKAQAINKGKLISVTTILFEGLLLILGIIMIIWVGVLTFSL